MNTDKTEDLSILKITNLIRNQSIKEVNLKFRKELEYNPFIKKIFNSPRAERIKLGALNNI